jgi:hypothetical protein
LTDGREDGFDEGLALGETDGDDVGERDGLSLA